MKSIYVKTALYVYPKIVNVAKHIDDVVMKRAIGSRHDRSYALPQYEKIVDLTIDKDKLFALKLRIEDVLQVLTERELKAIDYKYFNCRLYGFINNSWVRSRPYFYTHNKLDERLPKIFDNNGMTDEWFETEYLSMPIFKGTLNEVQRRINVLKKYKECESVS